VQPCRLELVREAPLVYIDGAHNPDGANALARSLAEYKKPGRRVLMVAGILEKKDGRGILEVFARCADTLWLTRPIYKRSLTPEVMLEEISGVSGLPPGFLEKNVHLAEDFRKAVAAASKEAGEGDLVVVAGSLYLVGDVREYIRLLA
ncbi:MAG: hypothetical protein FWF44_03900, partial [Defluviitaleaceae bacterium]|nr:hypothetical protein [Defluviitaleaceae bacterium]